MLKMNQMPAVSTQNVPPNFVPAETSRRKETRKVFQPD
jgi:hypothetical protein